MKQTCRKCDIKFQIFRDEDSFLKKISPVINDTRYDLPLPTLCPQCRNRRRMAWRNDRSFHHRTCDLNGKQIISIYPPKTLFPVYEASTWYSDAWDPMDFGRELNLTQPFFDAWRELMKQVPRLGLDVVNCENSDYCNYCGDDKNCYLDIAGEANEDCYFNLFTKHSKNCVDCTFVYHSTLTYESIQCYHCYNVRYSSYLENCSDCTFCFDLKGCKNCLFSYNLRNKEYYIDNQPYSKKDYNKKLEELSLGSFDFREQARKRWDETQTTHAIHRNQYLINCENSFGNNVKHSKNCMLVYNATNCEDCRYLYDVLDATDCQDLNYSLYHPEMSYELISTLQMRSSAFNMASHYCSNVFYCDLCNHCSNLFGCIGLRHKSYCIFNKQYSRADYEGLVPKLINQMLSRNEWGEFFPASLSPFGYNETVAQEYFPLTPESAIKNGLNWREEEDKKHRQQTTSLTDNIRDTDSTISKEMLVCTKCSKNYRVIKQELAFYHTQEIPVPRCCPKCRHEIRNTYRNPRTMWERECTKCNETIRTTFAPERTEKIYCQECYVAEVYYTRSECGAS